MAAESATVDLKLVAELGGAFLYQCHADLPTSERSSAWVLAERAARNALGQWVVSVGASVWDDQPLRRSGVLGDWTRNPDPYLHDSREAAELAYAKYLLLSGG